MKPRISLALLLPLLAFAVSFLVWIALTTIYFFTLRHAAHGSDAVYIQGGATAVEVPANAFKRFSFMSAAMRLENAMTVAHAPAHFFDLLIAYIVSRRPFWFPEAIGPAAWRCLIYPVLSIPAWWYVGRGLDSLFDRKGVGQSNVGLSAALVLIFGTLAAFLRFGLAGDPGLVPGYTSGFTLWTLLFAIPLAAAVRTKTGSET